MESTKKQGESTGIEQTVMDEQLTVEYWRERYTNVVPRFADLYEVCDLLGPEDEEFAKARGFVRLQNVHLGRGGLRLTAKAVQIMERLRPVTPQANA